MNRIKGSVMAKIVAWLLLLLSGSFFVGSCFMIGVMEDCGIFHMSKEIVLEKERTDINERYSMIALAKLQEGEDAGKKYFSNKAFRYGIIETKNLDGINLNDANNYIERNFSNVVKEENLYYFSAQLSDNADIWYSDDLYGDWGYQMSNSYYQNLYAERICYDTEGGIFYYLADNKYYPVQKVDIMVSRNLNENEYEYEYEDYYYTFHYDYEKKKYINPYVGENIENEEEMNILYNKQEITFDMFDETALAHTNWTSIIFDDVRQIQREELLLIDSGKLPKQSFVETEDSFLDENYTLYVLPKSDAKNYYVVSYVDEKVLAAEKQEFLNSLEGNGWEYKLKAVFQAQNVDLYVLKEVLVNALYEIKDEIVGILYGTFLVAVASFVFLICAAGHRAKRKEIVPTFIDKIPLDVYGVLLFFTEGLLTVFLREACCLESTILLYPFMVMQGMLMIGLLILSCLSLVVRIKLGKWWRNTILYRVYAKIRTWCRRIWENIEILWKGIAIYACFIVMEIFLGFCIFGAEPEVMLMVFLPNIIVFPILITVALQFQKLQESSRMIAEGDLQYKIDTNKMFLEFKKHADNLNRISDGMAHAVDERMKSERFKTELITNVSHDIKTPLTSIINYVDLLAKEDIQNETAKEYLEVLERQSARLKKLIEDLIEASKASTGNLSVNMEKLEANVFVTQILGEFEGKIADADLELIINKPEEEIPIHADGRHLWRVVDNLINNICKYAQPGSRVYMNLEQTQNSVILTFKNMSKYALNVTSEELMERFVRGDSSRHAEGNGLGLSIAKSLMELMNGKMSLYVDGDLFKVVLEFPKVD